jgi:hypothetical protein
VRTLLLFVLALGCGRTEPLAPPSYSQRLQEGTCPVSLSLDFQGVWTNPNPHSKVPSGAARRAENLINPKPGVAECVAGQETLAGTYTASDERLSSATTYDGFVIESTAGATDKLYRLDPSTLTRTAYSGSYSPPSGVERVPMAVAGEKLYLATSAGLQVVDGVTGTPADVGVPKAWAPFLVNAGIAGTFLPNNSSVAYRATISKQDANDIWLEGSPGGRVADTNVSGGAAGVSVTTQIPTDAAAGDRFRLYRTTSSTTDPGDNMFLVHEHTLVAADFTNPDGYDYDDDTPDELLGPPLYTNATRESILRQNERPPYAEAILGFDDSLLLGNVRGPQQFVLRLLAPLSPGDTITINGLTYTAVDPGPTAVQAATGDFYSGGGIGTVSEQIQRAMLELTYTIRLRTGNTAIRSDYLSGGNDAPGLLGLEAIDVTTGAFTVSSSVGDSFEPNLTTAQSSLATTEPNGIWVSKRGQHYAFPPLRSAGTGATYRFKVGTKGGAILAMAALRDSVIVFVEKEGVFKVRRTGAESWRSDQINNNAHLLVPGSVAVVDNQVLALTTRGLVAVDESGVEEIDLPIKDKFKAIIELGPDLLLPLSFAVGDEARLRYIFYHPLTSASTTADHAWVYNADQGTWTERTDAASGGFVSEDDGLLYLGSATSNTLTRERTGTDAQVYKRPDNTAIPVRLEWTVMDEEDPGAEKQFTEIRLLTEDAITGDVTFNCTNDLGGTESTTGSTSDNATGEPFVLAWVPDGCQRTTRLRVDIQRSVLGEAFEVVGFKALVAGTYNGGMQR